MIFLFTDFGWNGPYVGQMKTVLARQAPGSVVVDLMHDAPAFNPRAAAYLLATLVAQTPENSIILAVVDPGVGNTSRKPVILEVDGRWLVGPDNGLFSVMAKRGEVVECRHITWRPETLSNTFHGRDLFAPVAAMLANGELPAVSKLQLSELVGNDWPEELAEIIYIDNYGNAMLGIRAGKISPATIFQVDKLLIPFAATFSAVATGDLFWYCNSNGLVEIAMNQGSVTSRLGLAIGRQVEIADSDTVI